MPKVKMTNEVTDMPLPDAVDVPTPLQCSTCGVEIVSDEDDIMPEWRHVTGFYGCYPEEGIEPEDEETSGLEVEERANFLGETEVRKSKPSSADEVEGVTEHRMARDLEPGDRVIEVSSSYGGSFADHRAPGFIRSVKKDGSLVRVSTYNKKAEIVVKSFKMEETDPVVVVLPSYTVKTINDLVQDDDFFGLCSRGDIPVGREDDPAVFVAKTDAEEDSTILVSFRLRSGPAAEPHTLYFNKGDLMVVVNAIDDDDDFIPDGMSLSDYLETTEADEDDDF